MEAKLRRADIVIIASAHNPSIIAPQWLKDNSLIIEKPKHFVHTPEFSLFESESFSLVVDHERLQIIAKKQDEGSLRSLANIGSNYVKLLSHIPYIALGFNFLWSIEINKGEKLPKIGLDINKSNLMSAFKGHKVNYGGIVYAGKEPYKLKLVIEPQGGNTLVHNFNYHHELKGMSTGDIIKSLNSFLIRYKDSSKIIKGLYLGGKK